MLARVHLIFGVALVALTLGPAKPANAQSCAPQSITWNVDGERHDTTVMGLLRDGCPVIRQSRETLGGQDAAQTGMDCDCDLLIDGVETLFAAPNPLAAKRLIAVCEANRAAALPILAQK